MMNPTFTVFCGCMFSGKTTALLSALERFKYQRKKVIAFKPTIDDRYSSGDVVSHSGWSMKAHTVKTGADILEVLSRSDHPDVIAVDEAFMIPNVADVLIWLYRSGITVVVATLDLSATGKPFQEVEKLLVWATHIEKFSSVCTVCGADAYYTHKKQTDEKDNIVVVGNEIRVGCVRV